MRLLFKFKLMFEVLPRPSSLSSLGSAFRAGGPLWKGRGAEEHAEEADR